MKSRSFLLVKDVLGRALDLPESERETFLTTSLGHDRELLAEARELLRFDDPSVGRDDALPHDKRALIGTTIDRYRVLDLLGEGGMGVVYLAEQSPPLRRRVALKVIRLGLDTAGVIARFRDESQALALMSDPRIATVFDAGSTAEGRPYFVMELVDGDPVTEYCDRRALPLPARLELFASVCLAVHHAHDRGVIHRDLKPGNILVQERDGVPSPKIIDFGIARAAAEPSAPAADPAAMMGTPEYMSPEQASGAGDALDARSDVYALGAILYELLTGTPPLTRETLQASGFQGIARRIREVEPEPPSRRVRSKDSEADAAAARRALMHRAWSPQLRNELDWIAAKALAKDPARRYASAAALAEDLRRHRDGLPIAAGPPSLGYRLRKRAARLLRPAVVSAAVLTALLAVLLAGTLRRDTVRTTAPLPSVALLTRTDPQDSASAFRIRGVEEYLATRLLDNESIRLLDRESLADAIADHAPAAGSGVTAEQIAGLGRLARATYVLALIADRPEEASAARWSLVRTGTGRTIAGDTLASGDAQAAAAGILRSVGRHLGGSGNGGPQGLETMITTANRAYRHYITGLLAREAGETRRATREFEAALAQDSTFAQAAIALTKTLIYDQNFTRAAEVSQTAWRLRDRLDRKSRMYLEAQRLQADLACTRASDRLAAMVALWPDDRELALEHVSYLIWSWSFTKGVDAARTALERFPGDPQLQQQMAMGLIYGGRPEEALGILEGLTGLDPNDAQNWIMLNACHLALGRPEPALAAILRAGDGEPGESERMLARAATLAYLGEVPRAQSLVDSLHLDPALSSMQRLLYPLSHRIDLLVARGRYREARSVLQALRSTNAGEQEWNPFLSKSASFQIRIGDLEGAVDRLAEYDALELDQSLITRLEAETRVHCARGDTAAAWVSLHRLEALPDRPCGYRDHIPFELRARIAMAAGRPRETLAWLAKVPHFTLGCSLDEEPHRLEARALHAAGRTEEAIALLQGFCDAQAPSAFAGTELARLLHAVGREAEARTVAQRSLAFWADADTVFPELQEARELAR